MHDPTDLLEARYGSQPKPKRLILNDQVQNLLQHRSIRTFLPDPLPTGALETMITAAQSASTSSNLHQWSVVAVDDSGIKDQLIHLSRSATGETMDFLCKAPVILLWVADNSRSHTISRSNGGTPEALNYLDALLTATVDATIAAQNAAVAAESMGLGIVYLGMMRNRAKELAELIGLPRYSFVVFGMAVGTPDTSGTHNIRPRPAQSVFLHRNCYAPPPTSEWLENYEKVFMQFRKTSGMRERTWREAVTSASSAAYMGGRENLSITLQERGYPLR